MTHAPPVPPANQAPYPREEPPHEHHRDAPVAKLRSTERPDHDDRIRNGVVAVLGIGAVAALVAGIVAAARRPAERPARHHKHKRGKKK